MSMLTLTGKFVKIKSVQRNGETTMENNITQSKIELMKKIIDAKLTPQELKDLTDFAASLIKHRPRSADKAE